MNLKFYTPEKIKASPYINRLNAEDRESLDVVAKIFPFRTNQYVLEELIDWDRAPEDPIFRLNFFDRSCLPEPDYQAVREALAGDPKQLAQVVNAIRLRMNPHPGGQKLNVPVADDQQIVEGLQHKYRNTVLVFPSEAQTCFAYCTFCFRWPQFVEGPIDKFKTRNREAALNYIKNKKDVSDVLFTGGDPMIMNADRMAQYLKPLLGPGFEHVTNIRIGTKFLSYWPHRVLSDGDADQMLRLFESVQQSGKHLSIMAHFNHPREMETESCLLAMRRLQAAGATIRTQTPLLRHINDDPNVWGKMWARQVALGLVPYYMFVLRDTGPSSYFEVPLQRAYDIFLQAQAGLGGLAKTARGPVLSSGLGKACIDGILELKGEKFFVLRYLQARDATMTCRPFLARFDSRATWINQLTPAPGYENYFESGHGQPAADMVNLWAK